MRSLLFRRISVSGCLFLLLTSQELSRPPVVRVRDGPAALRLPGIFLLGFTPRFSCWQLCSFQEPEVRWAPVDLTTAADAGNGRSCSLHHRGLSQGLSRDSKKPGKTVFTWSVILHSPHKCFLRAPKYYSRHGILWSRQSHQPIQPIEPIHINLFKSFIKREYECDHET